MEEKDKKINKSGKGKKQYGNTSISQLKGADRVRLRPGGYVWLGRLRGVLPLVF